MAFLLMSDEKWRGSGNEGDHGINDELDCSVPSSFLSLLRVAVAFAWTRKLALFQVIYRYPRSMSPRGRRKNFQISDVTAPFDTYSARKDNLVPNCIIASVTRTAHLTTFRKIAQSKVMITDKSVVDGTRIEGKW